METDCLDSLDADELRLVHEHEQILRTREKLEEERKRVDDARAQDRKRLLKDRVEDERRADDLREAAAALKRRIDAELEGGGSGDGDKKLDDLRENYWAMVKNVKPVWDEEVFEYEEKQKKKAQ